MNSTVAVASGSSWSTSIVSVICPSTLSPNLKVADVAPSPRLTISVITSTVSRTDGSSRESVTAANSRSGIGVADVAVAEKRTEASPENASTDCMRTSPRVHSVDAIPSASVSTMVSLTDPLPSSGRKVTDIPSAAVPPWSSTRTTSGSANAVPLTASCSSPDTISIRVALCATSTEAVPLAWPEVAVSVPVPFPAAVTVAMDPLPLTAKTDASELDQLTAALGIALRF